MIKPNPPARLDEDSKLIARQLLGMAMPRLIRRAIVIAIAVLLWLFVCRAVLSFGAGVRYDSLAVFGQQAVDLLNRINPYLWWAVVAIITLIAFFALRSWYAASLAAGRATPVEPATLRELAARLSPDSLKVVHWVWRDHEEPLTVGDLHTTLAELRHGRVGKLYLSREQEAALAAGQSAAAPRAEQAQGPVAEPALREPALDPTQPPPAPAGRAEPGFGAAPRTGAPAGQRAEPRLPDADIR
ncbi:hypothetical protein V8Z80_10745 [Orrella sp. JC864]|uniref:hypothetical protein n=1 Tax=Orrella sp. JC864 TaxID=3120298 RepID=UPI00300AD9F5